MTLRIRARRNSANFELLANDVVVGVHTNRALLERQRRELRRDPEFAQGLIDHFAQGEESAT